jgi:hypothetical protein
MRISGCDNHFAESVLMEGHAIRKSLESDGKVPTEDESTKSPLGIEFSTEESSNHHGEPLELKESRGR